MRTVSGLLLLFAAFVLGVFEIVAIVDPVGTSLANDADPFGPPAPWYVHAGWIVAIVALTWAGLRLLNRGILGRLVRGRGFAPAPRQS